MENQIGRFAFQTGKWAVHHRKLRTRLNGCEEWDEFDGSCEAREIMSGQGNAEDNYLEAPEGHYRATALRRIDPESGAWEINWFDQRFSYVAPQCADCSMGLRGNSFVTIVSMTCLFVYVSFGPQPKRQLRDGNKPSPPTMVLAGKQIG